MLKRVFLAGCLGGIALFIWGSLAHTVLPLGEAGLRSIPNDSPAIVTLKSSLPEPGFYYFPGPGVMPGATREQKHKAMEQAMEKYRTGPHGILIFNPQGSEPMPPSKLLTQAGTCILEMYVVALVLALGAIPGYGRRVLFVALLGLLPWLAVHVPYWNWFEFPGVYTAAQLVTHLVGYVVAAFVVAAFMKPASA